MKLVTVFLLVSVSICIYSATAFLTNSLPDAVNKVLLLPVDNIHPFMDPLKLLLNTLGISIEHLVEGLRKCVNELGPEASEAVKKLLVTIGCGLICQWGELSHLNAPPMPPLTLFSPVDMYFPGCTHTKFACPGISRKVQHLHF
uniref:secretoglobin family 3A member 2 n=1 Tax=Odobenus rosmarus divergens TaxID=9708 RepID=UPI00063C1880|nr:PREDICTED: secretoglobin family 3A member 2 [Odobenus rosmarus divergens]